MSVDGCEGSWSQGFVVSGDGDAGSRTCRLRGESSDVGGLLRVGGVEGDEAAEKVIDVRR